MPNLCLPPLLAAWLTLPAAAQVGGLETDLRLRISGETGAVSLAYLGGGPHDSLLIDGRPTDSTPPMTPTRRCTSRPAAQSRSRDWPGS